MSDDRGLVERLKPSFTNDRHADAAARALRLLPSHIAEKLNAAILANNDLKDEAAAAIERLLAERDEARRVHHWSIDDTGYGTLHVCRNEHDKGDKCEWETFVPIARAEAAEAQRDKLKGMVEQAFRDGLAYATNVVVTDADEAWRTSRARQALQDTPSTEATT